MELDELELACALAELQVAFDRANHFAKAEKAPSTRKAYRGDFAAFQAWCAAGGVPALPAAAETVAAFLSAEADRGMKASSIARRLAAIRYAHKLASVPLPNEAEVVRAVLRGIRRTIGTATSAKVPATNDRLRAMIATQKMESRKTKWLLESQGWDHDEKPDRRGWDLGAGSPG